MNRAEFMRRLTELLDDVSPMERDEAIQYYNDYFDDAGVENESGVIASLGTPEDLARTIKAGLSDGGNGGEFTESGFHGYAQAHKDEMIKAGEAGGSAEQSGEQQDTNRSGNTGSGAQNGNAYYQGGYYQRNGSDSVYGGRKIPEDIIIPTREPKPAIHPAAAARAMRQGVSTRSIKKACREERSRRS